MDHTTKFQVPWIQVCQTERNGGLGIKAMKVWNKVAIGKLILDLFKEKKSLWGSWIWNNKLKVNSFWDIQPKLGDTQVWHSLLNLREDLINNFSSNFAMYVCQKPGDTQVWRNLLNLREDLVNNFIFKLRDGSVDKFFTDHWMEGNRVFEILDQQTQHMLC